MVLNTEQISEKVWKEQAFQSDNTVMVHIRKIREKDRGNSKEASLY